MSQQTALAVVRYLAVIKTKHIVDCISNTVPREVVIPFYSALLANLEYYVQFQAAQYKRDSNSLVRVQWRATNVARELVYLIYKENPRELGMVCPE